MTQPRVVDDLLVRRNLALSLLEQREVNELTLELAVMALRGYTVAQLHEWERRAASGRAQRNAPSPTGAVLLSCEGYASGDSWMSAGRCSVIHASMSCAFQTFPILRSS